MSDFARQGTLDGLCGIYCAAHVLTLAKDGDYEDDAISAFSSLLKSAERLNLLNADHLAGRSRGYSDLQVARIFNEIPARSRAGLEAVAFRNKGLQASHLYRRAKDAIAAGASLIVHQNGGDHWVAVTDVNHDLSYRCYDPWLGCNDQVRVRISWRQGVLIAPRNIIGEL